MMTALIIIIFLLNVGFVVCGYFFYKKYEEDVLYNESKLNEIKEIVRSHDRTMSSKLCSMQSTMQSEFRSTHSQVSNVSNGLKNMSSQNKTYLSDRIGHEANRVVECVVNQQSINSNDIRNLRQDVKNRSQEHTDLINVSISKIQDLSQQLSRETNAIRMGVDCVLESLIKEFSKQTSTFCNLIKSSSESSINEVIKLQNTCEQISRCIEKSHDSNMLLFKRIDSFGDILISLDKLLVQINGINSQILTQENSLTFVANKHREIAIITDELNRTAKDVFGLMKLLLMSSVVQKSTEIIPNLQESVVKAEAERKNTMFSAIQKANDSIRTTAEKILSPKTYVIQFNVDVKYLSNNQIIGIVGNIPELGNWQQEKFVALKRVSSCKCAISLNITTNTQIIEYKYVVVSTFTNKSTWADKGDNRKVNLSLYNESNIIRNDSLKA